MFQFRRTADLHTRGYPKRGKEKWYTKMKYGVSAFDYSVYFILTRKMLSSGASPSPAAPPSAPPTPPSLGLIM